MDLSIQVSHFLIHGNVKVILFNLKANQLISSLLQLRRNDVAALCDVYCKGYQSGRNVNVVEGTGHGILTTDGRKAKADLCVISAKQCCEGLAPTGRIARHSAEVLLEGKANLGEVTAICNDLCHGLYHCINCTMVRAPA